MRAIPSFTSSTVPTSRTSISARSAVWISLRRISFSSPGRRMESVAMGAPLGDCEKYHMNAECEMGNAEFPWEVALRATPSLRSEEHTSELQSQSNLVCRLLLEKKKTQEDLTFAAV